MTNKEFAKGLETRTKKFAVNIVMLSTSLLSTPEGKVIRNQITKSGTYYLYINETGLKGAK
jgi:hypothetical protein